MLQLTITEGTETATCSMSRFVMLGKRVRGTEHQPSKVRAGAEMQTPFVHIGKKKQDMKNSMHCDF